MKHLNSGFELQLSFHLNFPLTSLQCSSQSCSRIFVGSDASSKSKRSSAIGGGVTAGGGVFCGWFGLEPENFSLIRSKIKSFASFLIVRRSANARINRNFGKSLRIK